MQPGHMTIILTALAGIGAILSMVFGVDIAGFGDSLGKIAVAVLIVLLTIEWRRRSKQFDD